MKVVLHYAAGPGLARRVAEVERQQGLRVALCPVADRARYGAAMADAEVLWHLLDPVTEAVLDGAPALRLVQKIGVGVNTIDLEAARRRGVAVCNMPGTNTQAVAEMTLLLILAVLRRVARLDAATRARGGLATAGGGPGPLRRGEGPDDRPRRLRRGPPPAGARARRAGRARALRQPQPEARGRRRAALAGRPAPGERRRLPAPPAGRRHRAAHRRRRHRPHEGRALLVNTRGERS